MIMIMSEKVLWMSMCGARCCVEFTPLVYIDGPVKEVKESVNTIFKSIDTNQKLPILTYRDFGLQSLFLELPFYRVDE